MSINATCNDSKPKSNAFFQSHLMANKTQWVVAGVPNNVWAKSFPELNEEDAFNKLWDAILNTARVYEDNDIIKEWDIHKKHLLNTINIK